MSDKVKQETPKIECIGFGYNAGEGHFFEIKTAKGVTRYGGYDTRFGRRGAQWAMEKIMELSK